MLQARYRADLKALQDQGHPEKLTRTEWAKKKADFQTQAEKGVAERLTDRIALNEKGNQTELLQWMRLERAYLDLKLDRNVDRVAKECWAILGDAPQPPVEEDAPRDDKEAEAARMRLIENLAKQRAFATLNYLAVRRSAKPELAQRLQKYIGAGFAVCRRLGRALEESRVRLVGRARSTRSIGTATLRLD